MKKITAICATCDNLLEETLEHDLPLVDIVESCRFQEELYAKLKKHSDVDVLILKENFPGSYLITQVVKDIREEFPNIRIVFFATNDDPEKASQLRTYLYLKQVYDIINDWEEYEVEDVATCLFRPKSYNDIVKDAKKLTVEEEMAHIKNARGQMDAFNNPSTVEAPKINLNYNNNVSYEYPSQKTVAFWSPKGGAGVDSLAISTALMLAKNTEIEVCIADFSEMPNAHLYFNLSLEDLSRKNIEVLYVQSATGKLNQYSINKFIIDGGETNIKAPNLSIIPGAVTRINFFKKIEEMDPKNVVGESFENIINILREKFNVVILILSPSLYHIPTLVGLRKANQINVILENDVSCFYNARRYFDERTGLFSAFKISKDKCKFIVNKSYVDDRHYISKFKDLTGFEVETDVGLVPEEMYEAVKRMNLHDALRTDIALRDEMLKVVRTITYMSFNDSKSEQPQQYKEEGKSKLSGIAGLFKKNK